MATIAVLPGLLLVCFRRLVLLGDAAAWPEKNCYADLWIGFLHTLGLEPLAMLPFTVAVDFEGDQWTFFKPPQGSCEGCSESTCRNSPSGARSSSMPRSTSRRAS